LVCEVEDHVHADYDNSDEIEAKAALIAQAWRTPELLADNERLQARLSETETAMAKAIDEWSRKFLNTRAQRDELVVVLRDVLETHDRYLAPVHAGVTFPPIEAARAVLAKMTGEDRITDSMARYKTPNNTVFVHVWQRDADYVEGDEMHEIEATPAAYDALVARVHDNSEGSVRIQFATAEEAAAFESSERYLVLEAFENGEHYDVTPRRPGM
jgi:hypothetical protein